MFSSSLHGTAAACSSPILHYYHHQLQESSHFQSPNLVVQDAAGALPIGCTITTPSVDESKAMNMMPEESAEAVPKKIKKKPDKRSKVRTSKGLRDRRVRMSIVIARKFFDLQDLLGFDKPSKTLEWLLTNSNKAILELSGSASSSSLTSSDQETALVKRPGDSHHSTFSLHTIKEDVKPSRSESRGKARARARARTVAKLSNQQKNRLLNNAEDMMSTSGNHQTYFGLIMPMRKLVECKSHEEEEEEEERKTTGGDHEQQHKQSHQELQLQNYDSAIKCYHHWSGLNPNSSLDYWDINCAYFQQGSSNSAHQLNLSMDYNITGGRASSWDNNIHSDYKPL